eukprot:TRINITY_DN18632_c0_g1_i1.p2 TRINITY_DN18632_c0_g1~~TRINITY_DN18632_c0_g1_i1.p2  ORF type:complete len:304 (+),score=103.91 TRINITY_DN18632_c0_g1_i1:54-965(+)
MGSGVAMDAEKATTLLHFTAAYAAMAVWCYWANTADALRFFRDVVGIDVGAWAACGDVVDAPAWVFHTTLPTMVYWTASFAFCIADMCIRDVKYWKIEQPGFTARIDHQLIRKGVNYMLFNTVVASACDLFAMQPLVVAYRQEAMCGAQLPGSVADVVLLLGKLIGVFLLSDVVFYITHRLCHESTFLYRHIHKLHHQWTETYAINAAACHPLEQWFVNVHTISLPSIIMGIPFHWYTGWLCLAMVNTCISHCGYKMGHLTGAHDAHHHFLDCEYGTDTFCDKLFGTTYDDYAKQKVARGKAA